MDFKSQFISVIRNSRIFRYYMLFKNRKKWIYSLRSHFSSLSDKGLKDLFKKFRYVWIKYKIGPGDFYMLHCEDKSMEQISELLAYWDFYASLCLRVNSSKVRNVVDDKYNSYVFFQKYYGRRALLITLLEIDNGIGLEKLKAFVGKTDQSYIIKPLNMSSGKGIKVMSSIPEILEYVKMLRRDVIIEELIIQDESLAEFNNSSVNTLRINTANYDNGEVDILWPCLRIGRAGSIVDNAGSGGIFAAIDVTTGKTIAASDESRNVWKVHPDSKCELIGYSIPRWQEAVELVKELANVIPDAGFVGWDLALTKQGWVMIEANSGPLIIYQIAVNRGLRAEFCEVKKKFISVSRQKRRK